MFCLFFVCRAQGEEETFAGVTGVVGKAAGEGEAGGRSPPGSSSYRRRSVGVVQHGVEGAGEVVGVVAAVVLLRHGHQAGQADEEEEEEVDGERRSEDAQHEGLALRGGGGGDGGGGAGGGRGGGAIQKVRTGGNAASGAWRSAPAVREGGREGGTHTHTHKLIAAERKCVFLVLANYRCAAKTPLMKFTFTC